MLPLIIAIGLTLAPPEELAGHALVYSFKDKAVLLIGGDGSGKRPIYRLKGDTWDPVPGSELPIRSLPAVAADSEGNVLMHGGAIGTAKSDGSIDFKPTGETWFWNGTKWRLLSTTGPEPRDHHAMAFDSARNTFVMFGGSDADPSGRTKLFGDTWEWHENRWKQVSTMGPSPRPHIAMAYDPERKQTILLGGGEDAKTWGWDGKVWRVLSDGPPANRSSSRLAWNSKSKTVLLFGGDTPEGWPRDLWEWNGSKWQAILRDGPPGRTVHGMAFDETLGTLIVYGGAGRDSIFGDIWKFKDGSWIKVRG